MVAFEVGPPPEVEAGSVFGVEPVTEAAVLEVEAAVEPGVVVVAGAVSVVAVAG